MKKTTDLFDIDSFQKIIENVYHSATDTSQWTNTLTSIANTLGCKSAMIRAINTRDNSLEFKVTYNYDPDYVQRYGQYYVKMDCFNNLVEKTPEGYIMTEYSHPDIEKIKKSEFYNDYLLPQDIYHVAGGAFLKTHSRYVMIGLQHSKKMGAFDKQHIRFLTMLNSHLKQAFTISQRLHNLEYKNATLHATLNKISTAIFGVNQSGYVLLVNGAADTLTRSFQNAISIKHGVIKLSDYKKDSQLKKLIQENALFEFNAHIAKTGAIHLPEHKLSILVAPITRQHVNHGIYHELGNEQITALVFVNQEQDIQQPRHKDEKIKLLKALHGLTRAEARLALALAAGAKLEDIAADFSVSRYTLRAHLRSIFTKTGVSRQAELVKLMLSAPISHMEFSDLE